MLCISFNACTCCAGFLVDQMASLALCWLQQATLVMSSIAAALPNLAAAWGSAAPSTSTAPADSAASPALFTRHPSMTVQRMVHPWMGCACWVHPLWLDPSLAMQQPAAILGDDVGAVVRGSDEDEVQVVNEDMHDSLVVDMSLQTPTRFDQVWLFLELCVCRLALQ